MTPVQSVEPSPSQKVAAIVCAHNVGRQIASTVRACRAIPGVDLLIVIDDGSDDETGKYARAAGAVVVRHSVPRGRASARETGVKVAAMRDRVDAPGRHILFLSGDLGESAVDAAFLVEAISSGRADLACAVPAGLGSEDPSSARKETAAQRLAHNTIRRQTGWDSQAPLSEQLCITREALNAIMPFANGYGLELDMKVRLLALGMTAIELPCAFEHTGDDHSLVALNRPASLADVAWTSTMLALRKVRLRRRYRTPVSAQRVGIPFPDPEHTPISQSHPGEVS